MATFPSATNCDCAICRHQHGFTIPDELLTEILHGKVTLFAGAGVSTESSSVLNVTLYDEIALELGIDHRDLSFPELMQRYCDQINGRFKLIRSIVGRFETIDSFPELRQSATSFHRELGSMFQFRNIITTNWDAYFERECMATPFVEDSDLAFWQAAPRRVLKLHGSVSNLGSIVATTTDYTKCKKRLEKGLIGGLLKSLMATETMLFIGYSFSDSDFSSIQKFVRKQMHAFHRQAYVVTPFEEEAEKFRSIGLIPICTDGTYLLQQLKKHAAAMGVMLSDEIFDAAEKLMFEVQVQHRVLHKHIKPKAHPEMVYAAFYQDGMMHALSRAISMRGSGIYTHRCDIHDRLRSYGNVQKVKRKERRYDDVAYIEGYINALF